MANTIPTYVYSRGIPRWYDIFFRRSDKGKIYITKKPRKSEKDLVFIIELTPTQYEIISETFKDYKDSNGELVAFNINIFISALKEIGIYVKSDNTIYKVAKSIHRHSRYTNKCVLMFDDEDIK